MPQLIPNEQTPITITFEKGRVRKTELENKMGYSREDMYKAIKNISHHNEKAAMYFIKKKNSHFFLKPFAEMIIRHISDEVEIEFVEKEVTK